MDIIKSVDFISTKIKNMEKNTERTSDQLSDELSFLNSRIKRIELREDLLFEDNLAYGVIIDADGRVERVNKAFLKELNYSKTEVVGELLINFIVEDQRDIFLLQFKKGFGGEHTVDLEVGIYAKDKSIKTILFSSTQLLFQEEGSPQSIMVSGIDITVRKKAEEKLGELQKETWRHNQKLEEVLEIDQRISAILRLDHLIDFIIDKATQVLDAKRCSLMLLDRESKQLVIKGAKGLSDEVIKNSRVKLGKPIAGLVAQDAKPLIVTDIEIEPICARRNRSFYKGKSFLSVPIKLHNLVIGVLNISEKGPGGQGIFTNADLKIIEMIIHQGAIAIENANYYKELEYLSTTDFMTGLYNHRYFMRTLRQEIERSRRHLNPICLLMLDVDDFKSYNDTFGHLEGDQALIEISRVLKENLRKLDVICRYAGDEFAIIFLEANIVQAQVASEKVQKAIANLKLKRKITLSMGLSSYHRNNDAHDFIRKADQALYQVKENSKGGICYLP